MNKYFGDENIAIKYVQKILNETFNDAISVTGEYYKHFDMNYGFAHYIARYLDYMYPVLDKSVLHEYKQRGNKSVIRNKEKMISICNYFLCDNNNHRLFYIQTKVDNIENNGNQSNVNIQNETRIGIDEITDINSIYKDIYNEFMRLPETIYLNPVDENIEWTDKYMLKNDPPLFTTYDPDDTENHWKLDEDTIFRLESWKRDKKICEIDDLVMSFLLGRTIGPNSTMEDIHYAQKLLIRDRNIQDFEKGIWCPVGYEGTQFDMTQTVANYQKELVANNDANNVFVTGYFDIYTEACILKEVGDSRNGILGL